MKENQIYVHYGHRKFSKEMYRPIENIQLFTKPKGGFWASRIDAKFGWKDWCIDEEFRDIDENNAFRFKLKDGAKVLYINNTDILSTLPMARNKLPLLRTNIFIFLDFEKLSKEYDAIEVNISECRDLYYSLCGWDCDSILIMNPDIIEEVKQ